MHVEHWRPKSLYPRGENRYDNLFYACAICNAFKGDDWIKTRQPHGDIACYPNPCKTDYCDLFDESDDFTLQGKRKAGTFLVERLFLNRPQLLIERRVHRFRERADHELAAASVALKQATATGDAATYAAALALSDKLANFARELLKFNVTRPYEPEDASRP